MSWGSDKRHFSHLPLPPSFFPFAPTRSCDRLAAALARHMLQNKSFQGETTYYEATQYGAVDYGNLS